MCYRTEEYTVCKRVRASFSPEILQAGAVKGLKEVMPLRTGFSQEVTRDQKQNKTKQTTTATTTTK